MEEKNDELEEALKSKNWDAIRAKLVALEQAVVNIGVPWHVIDRLREATLTTQRRFRKKQKVDPKQEHPGDIDEDA